MSTAWHMCISLRETKVHVPPTCVERCMWRSARSVSAAPQINRPVSKQIRLSILLPMLQDNSVFTHRLRSQHFSADYINVIYFRGIGQITCADRDFAVKTLRK
jgi:hypothetical protein